MSLLTSSAAGPLGGIFAVPGDKSISHRALILGALAGGETRITGLLESDDVLATARAVAAFGARVERTGAGQWRVAGARWHEPAEPIDCGNSGTAARLLMGAAAGQLVSATFTGDDSLRGRPMKRVTDPLSRMGARFEGGDTLPLRLAGGALGGIDFTNSTASAQVKSAILLAGLGATGEVVVHEPARSRDHSENMLRAFGAEVAVEPHGSGGWTIRLGPRRTLAASPVAVPGDPSSAAFAWVAALIVPGSAVTTPGVLLNPLRTGLLASLEEMGGDIRVANRRTSGGEEVGDVSVRHSPLRGIVVPAARAPAMIDEYPLLAVAAAFASGETAMHGLHELRVKESDRFQAIRDALAASGVAVAAERDSLIVKGGAGRVAGGGLVATHGDHRIAMANLVLGLASDRPLVIDRSEMIATSFPSFVAAMRAIGALIEPVGAAAAAEQGR